MAETPATPEKCPHSHLSIATLKRIGKAVEKAGVEAVETAVDVALAGIGALSQD